MEFTNTCFVYVIICLISHLSVLDTIESGLSFFAPVIVCLAFVRFVFILVNASGINSLYGTYSLPKPIYLSGNIWIGIKYETFVWS